ncbi:MAG: sterol desaturase family protein [Rhodospirillales bacterium]|nr:sterol desaturase family protein [Rhodospirillales bacterium]
MSDFILANEPVLRLGAFLGVFTIMALWEMMAPCRPLSQPKLKRWFANLGIVAIDTLAVRLLVPIAAVGVAVIAAERGWGVFNLVDLPLWMELVLAVVIMDFAIYIQHVMFHAVPVLWRLHMVHHADLDYDVTTGARFHPIEILLSVGIKMAVIVLIGAPAAAVVVFEVLLNATAMFNHSNIRLPKALDGVLRLFLVTPDMHRVHHSVVPTETNTNYGFALSLWDRLMGTYRAQPSAGHVGMTIGLNQFRDSARLTLPWMLALPFVGKKGDYPIDRRGDD